MCMGILITCMSVHSVHSGCPLWLGEAVRGSGPRVIDSCEPPTWRMGINPGTIEKAASALNW